MYHIIEPAAAIPDADAQPLAEADLGGMTKLVNLRKLRERLGQTQEAFAAIYRIPFSTLRDWEEPQARRHRRIAARSGLTLPRGKCTASRAAARSRTACRPRRLRHAVCIQGRAQRADNGGSIRGCLLGLCGGHLSGDSEGVLSSDSTRIQWRVETMLEKEIEDAKRLVRTDAYTLSVGEIVNMYKDNELVINPDFQRLFRWEIGQKSRLIESILLGIPIPSIFVFEKEDSTWELIDGLQRISTLLEFMGQLRHPVTGEAEHPTALVATKYLRSLDKVVWEKSETISDIPFEEQRALSGPFQLAIRRSRLSVEILKRPGSNETKYDLFRRLNAGGTTANAQELRNVIIVSVNAGYAAFMRQLSQRQSFLTVLLASPDQLEKQRDMEYVSRFLVHTYIEYDRKLDVEEFIDDGLVKLAGVGETQQAAEAFNGTFDLLNAAHGANALRRFQNDVPTGRVGLAAFEGIAIGVANNILRIQAKADPAGYVRQRIHEFWQSPYVEGFFVAGLRGTIRIQRTLPFGRDWFAT
jgi:hypothetical protein